MDWMVMIYHCTNQASAFSDLQVGNLRWLGHTLHFWVILRYFPRVCLNDIGVKKTSNFAAKHQRSQTGGIFTYYTLFGRNIHTMSQSIFLDLFRKFDAWRKWTKIFKWWSCFMVMISHGSLESVRIHQTKANPSNMLSMRWVMPPKKKPVGYVSMQIPNVDIQDKSGFIPNYNQ